MGFFQDIVNQIKSWSYGGSIERTVGEVQALDNGHGSRILVRVHVMKQGEGPDRVVGVEIVLKGGMHYSSLLAMLNVGKVEWLIEKLQEARSEGSY